MCNCNHFVLKLFNSQQKRCVQLFYTCFILFFACLCTPWNKYARITVCRQRSIRPQVVTTFELPGCTDMWTVVGPKKPPKTVPEEEEDEGEKKEEEKDDTKPDEAEKVTNVSSIAVLDG